MIASTACSLLVTFLTQCLDPPAWVESLPEWRAAPPPPRVPRCLPQPTRAAGGDQSFTSVDPILGHQEQQHYEQRADDSFLQRWRKLQRKKQWAYCCADDDSSSIVSLNELKCKGTLPCSREDDDSTDLEARTDQAYCDEHERCADKALSCCQNAAPPAAPPTSKSKPDRSPKSKRGGIFQADTSTKSAPHAFSAVVASSRSISPLRGRAPVMNDQPPLSPTWSPTLQAYQLEQHALDANDSDDTKETTPDQSSSEEEDKGEGKAQNVSFKVYGDEDDDDDDDDDDHRRVSYNIPQQTRPQPIETGAESLLDYNPTGDESLLDHTLDSNDVYTDLEKDDAAYHSDGDGMLRVHSDTGMTMFVRSNAAAVASSDALAATDKRIAAAAKYQMAGALSSTDCAQMDFTLPVLQLLKNETRRLQLKRALATTHGYAALMDACDDDDEDNVDEGDKSDDADDNDNMRDSNQNNNIFKHEVGNRRYIHREDSFLKKPDFPISPPLEVFAISFVEDEDLDLDNMSAPTKEETELLRQWNSLHYGSGPIFVEPLSDEDDESFEGSGLTSVYTSGTTSEQQRSKDDFEIDTSSPELVMESVLRRRTQRRQKRRKKRRGTSSGSVASSPSLLDITIEEETAADLEEEEIEEAVDNASVEPFGSLRAQLSRSYSAPNLAAFPSGHHKDGASVAGYSIHNVKSWTSDPSEDDGQNSARRISPDGISVKSWKKDPIFHQERELRGGIHATISLSDDECEAQGHATLARLARKQRLQQQTYSTTTIPKASPPRGVNKTADGRESPLFSDNDMPANLEQLDYGGIIDTLDLQLVQLRRPDGVEYGPDEVSL